MTLECENCHNNFILSCNSFSYWDSDFTLAGICPNCYKTINSKLKILVDDSKLILIKKKALEKRSLIE